MTWYLWTGFGTAVVALIGETVLAVQGTRRGVVASLFTLAIAFAAWPLFWYLCCAQVQRR